MFPSLSSQWAASDPRQGVSPGKHPAVSEQPPVIQARLLVHTGE